MGEDDPGSLGQAIRHAREQAGLSIRQLAAQVGVHPSNIGHLETGRNTQPAAELLQKIAEVCQKQPITLLRYIGVKSDSLLPEPREYFLRAMGASDDQADLLARLVKYQMGKGKEDKREDPG